MPTDITIFGITGLLPIFHRGMYTELELRQGIIQRQDHWCNMALDQILINTAITIAVSFLSYQITREKLETTLNPPDTFDSNSIPRTQFGTNIGWGWGTNKIETPVILLHGDINSYNVYGNRNSQNFSLTDRHLLSIFASFGLGPQELIQLELDDLAIWNGPNEDGIQRTDGRLGYPVGRGGSVRHREYTPPYTINIPDAFGELYRGGSIFGQAHWRIGDETAIQDSTQYQHVLRLAAASRGVTTTEAARTFPGYKGLSTLLLTGSVTHDGLRPVNPPRDGFEISGNPFMRRISAITRRIPNPLELPNRGRIPVYEKGTNRLISYDCNPMTVIYEILTHPYGSILVPESEIDKNVFHDAGRVLARENLGYSYYMRDRRTAIQFMSRLLHLYDGGLAHDESRNTYLVDLNRLDYNRGDLPKITNEDIDEIEVIKYININDAATTVDTTYKEVENGFKPAVSRQGLQAQIEKGRRQKIINISNEGLSNERSADFVGTKTLKASVADSLLVTFKGKRGFGREYRPSQRISFTYITPEHTFRDVPMKIVNLNRGSDNDKRYRFELLEDNFESDYTIFEQTPTITKEAPSIQSQPLATQDIFDLPYFYTRKLIESTDTDGNDPEETYIQYLGSRGNTRTVSFDANVKIGTGEFQLDVLQSPLTPLGVVSNVGNVNTKIPTSLEDSDDVWFEVSNFDHNEGIITSVSDVQLKNGEAMLMVGPANNIYSVHELVQYKTSWERNTGRYRFLGVRRSMIDTTRANDIQTGFHVYALRNLNDNQTSRRNNNGNEVLAFRLVTYNGYERISENRVNEFTRALRFRPELAMPLADLEIVGLTNGTVASTNGMITVIPKLKQRDRIQYEWENYSGDNSGGTQTRFTIQRNGVVLPNVTIDDTVTTKQLNTGTGNIVIRAWRTRPFTNNSFRFIEKRFTVT